MPQKIINVDSTILNSIQSCLQKTEYNFVRHIQPIEKGEALEKGDLMHFPLEIYYGLTGQCAREDSSTWIEIRKMLGKGPQEFYGKDRREIISFASSAARMHAISLNLAPNEVDEILYQFGEYCEYYKNEDWKAVAVEEVGSKILYEDEEHKFIYTFKIDVIAEKGNFICPWDHKTSSRRSNTRSLSNQFTGYCFGLNLNDIIINKIGFQKTLKPNERFQRVQLSYTPGRIQEWVDNTVWWMKLWQNCLETRTFPRDFTSCDKYSGCQYANICEKDEYSREDAIERDFKIGEAWDVGESLEVKNGL